MKPLSIFKFIKGSIRKIFPLAITVCLAVGLLYLLSICVSHILNENEEFTVAPLSNMSILRGTGEKVSDEVLNKNFAKLKGSKEIKAWYIVNLRDVNLNTPSSSFTMYFLMMENKNLSAIMKWQKLKLIEGVMPKNRMEVLLHKQIADNYNLKVGSVVKKGTTGWHVEDDIAVLGYIAGIALAVFAGWLMNVCLLSEKNIEMLLIRVDNLLWIFLVPVLVTVSGMIVPLKVLKFRDIT